MKIGRFQAKPNTQECVRARPFGGCWPPVRQTSLKSPCGVLSPPRLAAFGRTVADVLCPSASSKDQFRSRARPTGHKPAERKSITKIISYFRDPQWTKIDESKPLVKPLHRPGVCDADFVRTVIQNQTPKPRDALTEQSKRSIIFVFFRTNIDCVFILNKTRWRLNDDR